MPDRFDRAFQKLMSKIWTTISRVYRQTYEKKKSPVRGSCADESVLLIPKEKAQLFAKTLKRRAQSVNAQYADTE